MPEFPEAPVRQRTRLVRRRITAATLATFVTAWLAVAALGKGGASSTAATSPSPTTGTSSRSDDGTSSAQSGNDSGTNAYGPMQSGGDASNDGSSSTQSGDGSSSSADPGSSQRGSQGGPVTTSQS